MFQYLRGNNYLKGSNPECNPADRAFKQDECDYGDDRGIDEADAIADDWTVEDGGHMGGLNGYTIIFFYIFTQENESNQGRS